MAKTFGTISLVTGIVGLFIFGYILGIIAIITGILGIVYTKVGESSGIAVAGLVLGVLDVVLLFILQNILVSLL